jgi:hypothetical protein
MLTYGLSSVCPPILWVDVGTRPKVRWIYVLFHKKSGKYGKSFFRSNDIYRKVMLFWVNMGVGESSTGR